MQITVRWNAKIHDLTQLEISFEYQIQNYKKVLCQKKNRTPYFNLHLYFFIPGPSFHKVQDFQKKFYQYFKNKLRLELPPLKQEHTFCFRIVDNYLEQSIKVAKRLYLLEGAIQELKVFAYTTGRSLKDKKDKFRNAHALKALNSFRENYVGKVLRQKNLFVDQKFSEALLYIDEYLTHHYLTTPSQDLSYRKELEYYALHFNESGENSEDEQMQANYVYRLGQLKKFVSQGLYLIHARKKKEFMYKNIFAALAAGIAALFANLLRVEGAGHMINETGEYGLRFFTMLMLAILIYVFKDRIKDLSKAYFQERMDKQTPDYYSNIEHVDYSYSGEKSKLMLAHFTEHTTLPSFAKLNPCVKYVFKEVNKHSPFPMEYSSEFSEMDCQPIHYNKFFALEVDACKIQKDTLLFKDIFRFNISESLTHMDNAEKWITLFDSADEGNAEDDFNAALDPKKELAPKVYFWPMIIHLEVPEYDDEKFSGLEKNTISPYQITLNKKGLVRVQKHKKVGNYTYLGEEAHDA